MWHSSGEPDRARAKAVLAAVAAAVEVPAGAKLMTKEAFRKMVATCDVDLLAVCMCWANRMA
jgi:hypothetical protein